MLDRLDDIGWRCLAQEDGGIRLYIVELDRVPNTTKQKNGVPCRGECLLVLAGIEHGDDLSVARPNGVPLGQGFLLGHPDTV